jgi:hypothetical protein
MLVNVKKINPDPVLGPLKVRSGSVLCRRPFGASVGAIPTRGDCLCRVAAAV